MQTKKRRAHLEKVKSLGWEDKDWIDQELTGAYFRDVRLGKRLRTLLGLMSNGIGQTIPLACQDWANTKAAYRFFSNPRITEEEILSGHFASTQTRAQAVKETLLILHDTCEFAFKECADRRVGLLSRPALPSNGLKRHYTVQGLLMHGSLVVTPEGVPLGLAAIKFWTRKKFKGTNALKRTVNPTRVPIEQKESVRWLNNLREATLLLKRPKDCIHIGDRESDIYELFCTAHELGTKFVVRTCVNRLANGGQATVAAIMKRVEVKGFYKIEVRDQDGKSSKAVLEIKYEVIRVRPPIGKQNEYPELELTAIHAREKSKPRRRERIEWKLLTDVPVNSVDDAIEKLQWYAMRWKIETFHKILKSGCRAEDSKLRTAERLTRLIAVFCVLGWRVFWTTMVCRFCAKLSPEIGLTETERELLDKLIGATDSGSPRKLGQYLMKVARLGGYLARASDPPPGNVVMWRGISRLADIHLGFLLAKDVGN